MSGIVCKVFLLVWLNGKLGARGGAGTSVLFDKQVRDCPLIRAARLGAVSYLGCNSTGTIKSRRPMRAHSAIRAGDTRALMHAMVCIIQPDRRARTIRVASILLVGITFQLRRTPLVSSLHGG